MSGEVPRIEEFKTLANTIIAINSDDTQPIGAIDAPVENFCRMFKNIKENREVPSQNVSMCPCHINDQTIARNMRYNDCEIIYNDLINDLKNSTKGVSDKVRKLLNI